MNFNSIPNDVRIPIFMAEFDNSEAVGGLTSQRYKTLIVGQMLSGTADTLKPYRVIDKDQAANLFGVGSMIAEMVDYYRRVDPMTEVLAVAVPDAPSAQKAKATITITGMASAAGVLYCYINGIKATASVAPGADPVTAATALKTAIENVASIPCTVAATDGVLTLQYKHPGEVGNGIDVRFNYYAGEAYPVGLSVAVTAFTGGAVNPDVADALAVVMGERFTTFLCQYTDEANLAVIKEELERRFGPMVQQEAWHFAGLRGTHSELCAFGDARNNHLECLSNTHGIPNSPAAFAASLAANLTYYGNIDPARPFHTLTLIGILPPAPEDNFSDWPENNQLLQNGISTFKVESDQTVRIGRLVTTYKRTSNGASDTSYLDLNTGLTLGYLRHSLREYFQRKYPRCKLGNDSVLYDTDRTIMTPKLAKAECIAVFREWEKLGLVEDADQFKADLVVERSTTDRNRIEFRLSPNLINQLIVTAAQIMFRL
ncbi:MAG: phage tail sheath subtilisin-like domain-containing protein [Planctomycetaceae bacterium]|nr:phage tail sheath subtilisin-like domain-containing protein [Planctomycetaceae bacterium]